MLQECKTKKWLDNYLASSTRLLKREHFVRLDCTFLEEG